MKPKFISFSKIGQFRNVINDIRHSATYIGVDDDGNALYDNTTTLPTITFTGTVKLHGTNAGVAFSNDGDMWVQSRKNIITPTKDNAGFATFVHSVKDVFEKFNKTIRKNHNLNDRTIVIFGEWCGGNIQKGVAISGLEKMFVIFAVKVAEDVDSEGRVVDNAYYLPNEDWETLKSPNDRIYNINDYTQFSIDIDFENPKEAQSKMVEYVKEVEKECPVGKEFGRILGQDNTTGEGIVWVGWYNGNRYVFKTKGEKHSTSKVKTLAAVDVEKLKSINEFVDYAVTENRLNQAIEQVFTSSSIEPNIKQTGDFLRWVVNDIIDEELDTLVKNGLEPKDVNRDISKRARTWFMKYLESKVGL